MNNAVNGTSNDPDFLRFLYQFHDPLPKAHLNEHGHLNLPCRIPKCATLDDVRRVKDILNDPNTIVNFDHFLDILSMKRVLSVVDEREIRRKPSYKEKIDASFDILLEQDAMEMYETLMGTLREMGRSDIVQKIQQTWSHALKC